MRSKVSKATTHFCVGKEMTREDKRVRITTKDGPDSPAITKVETFASIRLAKHFMRTGKRSK